jgi:uncharacterized protein YggU (UPF0235/DUF167 family)
MSAGWWVALPDGRIRIRITAVPGASRTGLADIRPDSLRVRLAAAPEKGKANDELIDWLADQLGIRKSALSLETGATSRKKTVIVPAECRPSIEKWEPRPI